MIDITTWMNDFLLKLSYEFKNRVWFVGLQGSYGRGEATETSDIDIVETFLNLKNGGTVDFNLMSETLFVWSKNCISENS